jgi:hypothetical protein
MKLVVEFNVESIPSPAGRALEFAIAGARAGVVGDAVGGVALPGGTLQRLEQRERLDRELQGALPGNRVRLVWLMSESIRTAWSAVPAA